ECLREHVRLTRPEPLPPREASPDLGGSPRRRPGHPSPTQRLRPWGWGWCGSRLATPARWRARTRSGRCSDLDSLPANPWQYTLPLRLRGNPGDDRQPNQVYEILQLAFSAGSRDANDSSGIEE